LPDRIVLTGGGARLEGIAEAFKHVFGSEVEVGGVALAWNGCPESFRGSPEWCTVFGLADLSLAMHGKHEEIDIRKLLELPEQ
jgi:cell division ATPase FtsA